MEEQFEYLALDVVYVVGPYQGESGLDDYGNDGWRVVHVGRLDIYDGKAYDVLLMRRK